MFAAAGLADVFSSAVVEFASAAVVVSVAGILGSCVLVAHADFCSSDNVGVALDVAFGFGLDGKTCICHV